MNIPSFRGFAAVVVLASLFSGFNSHAQNTSPKTEVFLKAFYPLDEPRFHCIDIPGHRDRVNVERPLSVHTCKEGIWHRDEIFDSKALSQGLLKMPEYGLCVTAAGFEDGAKLSLKACNLSKLQVWDYSDFRLKLKSQSGKCITIGPEPSKLTPGGQRLPSRHKARSLQLAPCSNDQFQRQMWRFEVPQKRSSPVMPFEN